MSLRQQILQFIDEEPISIQTLYAKFPEQKQSTVRGRLYECLGKSVQRVGKGLYISSTAIVETGDAREIINTMVNDRNDKFDFIFLDVPYEMIKSLVNSFTNQFQWVFDPFVGSGVMVQVCKDLKRFCHVIDISENSIQKFVLPKL